MIDVFSFMEYDIVHSIVQTIKIRQHKLPIDSKNLNHIKELYSREDGSDDCQ